MTRNRPGITCPGQGPHVRRRACSPRPAVCPGPHAVCFGVLFQYEYFNAVLINERDKDGNFLELGKEFILAPNDHFNNLPVNISLSDVQVPTNMYNKGKTLRC